ncbi:hypothetical protein RND81_06G000200 [Saponaria officinalis]|uniref:Uncharacterized protein n=1 Tax=Saponaria officinalis TaxID=3572 RepID=A0AAW1K589_SAPOF
MSPRQASSSSTKTPKVPKIKLDPDQIPESHRFKLNLHGDEDKIYFFFDGLIWWLRTLLSIKGRKLDSKIVTSKSEEVFLINIKLNQTSIKVLIQKIDVYVVSIYCKGRWLTPNNSNFEIMGEEVAHFDKSKAVHGRVLPVLGTGASKNKGLKTDIFSC